MKHNSTLRSVTLIHMILAISGCSPHGPDLPSDSDGLTSTETETGDGTTNTSDQNDSANTSPTSAWIWPVSEDSQLGLQLNDTFGPRVQTSTGSYDFHRGVDISREVGTPIYAVADGEVSIAGYHSSYKDTTVQIKHLSEDGTFVISHYTHLSEVVEGLEIGDLVEQGELIALSGQGTSSYPHLHFEMRYSESGSSYQRNSMHPLGFLPYPDQTVPRIELNDIKETSPGFTEISVLITVPAAEADLIRVALEITDSGGETLFQNHVDFNEWNSAHTDTSALDNPDLYGIVIAPEEFNDDSYPEWALNIQFKDLEISRAQVQYAHVSATDTSGNTSNSTFDVPEQ